MVLASVARWTAIFGGGGSSDDEGGGGTIGLIAMALLAPFAAMIIQMAISRSREYLADSTGAGFAGTPEGLARALDKLGRYSKKLPMNANPSTAHMFIVNPLSGRSLMGFCASTGESPPDRQDHRIRRGSSTSPGQGHVGSAFRLIAGGLLLNFTAKAQRAQRFFSCSDFLRGEIRTNNLSAVIN
jgi:heat shock protein HtpX